MWRVDLPRQTGLRRTGGQSAIASRPNQFPQRGYRIPGEERRSATQRAAQRPFTHHHDLGVTGVMGEEHAKTVVELLTLINQNANVG